MTRRVTGREAVGAGSWGVVLVATTQAPAGRSRRSDASGLGCLYRQDMQSVTGGGRPWAGAAVVRALTVAAGLLSAFAWGLREVVEEARSYATVHGFPADTSRDEATTVVLLALAGGLLLIAAAVGRPRGASPMRRHG
ncbi:hypothetical protein CAE01nite_12640 [Cellulomonas aerilata]|uniref:Uncharacterized protein n=1 Tax=Cellulomonas aerilata TaxID=515326 RepID=A0A512DAP1_9CELL|nr:hypothetical protein CAE01nite_12640 [Cellulomonas aerilata]